MGDKKEQFKVLKPFVLNYQICISFWKYIESNWWFNIWERTNFWGCFCNNLIFQFKQAPSLLFLFKNLFWINPEARVAWCINVCSNHRNVTMKRCEAFIRNGELNAVTLKKIIVINVNLLRHFNEFGLEPDCIGTKTKKYEKLTTKSVLKMLQISSNHKLAYAPLLPHFLSTFCPQSYCTDLVVTKLMIITLEHST